MKSCGRPSVHDVCSPPEYGLNFESSLSLANGLSEGVLSAMVRSF